MWKRTERACGPIRRSLGEYLDGTLPLRRRRGVEAHLLACAECRREKEAMRRTLGLLASLSPRELPVSFDTALRVRLAGMEQPLTGGRTARMGWASRLPTLRYREPHLKAPWPSPLQRLGPAGAVAAVGLGLLAWGLSPRLPGFTHSRSGTAYVRMVVQQHKMLNAGSDMNATVVAHNVGGDLLGDGDEE